MRHCDLCGSKEHDGDRSTALALYQLRSGEMLFICEKCLSDIFRKPKTWGECASSVGGCDGYVRADNPAPSFAKTKPAP